MTTLIEKYLNLSEPNLNFIKNDNLNNYVLNFKECFINRENLRINIENKIKDYVDKEYDKIKKEDCDINYYIEQINNFLKIKFNEILNNLDLNLVISIIDYYNIVKTEIFNLKKIYYSYCYDKIIYGFYKIYKDSEERTLINLFDDNWSNINFNNLVEFTQIINKMKFYENDVLEFQKIIDKKFDDINNIKKMINYITTKFIEVDDNNDYDNVNEKVKFNFRFVIDNLKSNGYLLFEEYNNILEKRYKQTVDINVLKKDKKLIKFFMYIVSEKKSNTVNRSVNEILIRMKNYLYDLEDNYYNNINYKKINIKIDSDKYKDLNLNNYNRNKTNFNIFKYDRSDNIINNFKINKEIEPYLDIYKSYFIYFRIILTFLWFRNW